MAGIAGLGAFAGGLARGISEGERIRLMRENQKTADLQRQLLRQSIEENSNRLGMQSELIGIRPENYNVAPRDYALEGRTPTFEGMNRGLDEQDIPMRTEGISVRTPGGVDRERMYGDMAGIYYRHGNPQAGMQLENMRDNARYQETVRATRETLAALSSGNLAGAAKLMQDSFNRVPNGTIAHAEPTPDGNVNVRFFDQASGKPLKSKVVTPDELRQGMLMLSDPKAYQEMVDKGLTRQKDILVAQLNNLDKIYPRDKWHYGTYGEDHQPILHSDNGSILYPNALGGTAGLNRMQMDKQYRFGLDKIQDEIKNIYRTTDLSQLDTSTRALALDTNYFAQNAFNLNYDRSDEVGQIVRRTPATLSNLGHALAQLRNFDPKSDMAAQLPGDTPDAKRAAFAAKLGVDPVQGRYVYGREGSPYTYTMFRGKEYIVGSRDPAVAMTQNAAPQTPQSPLTGIPASQLPTVPGVGTPGGRVQGIIRRTQ